MTSHTLESRDLRLASGAMLVFAAVRPLIPHEPGIPCPLRTLTGIPCPLCGMTRSVTAAVHGHLAHSLALNPGGIVAVVVAVALLVAWRARRLTLPTWVLPATLALLWAYQLFKYTTGRPL